MQPRAPFSRPLFPLISISPGLGLPVAGPLLKQEEPMEVMPCPEGVPSNRDNLKDVLSLEDGLAGVGGKHAMSVVRSSGPDHG